MTGPGLFDGDHGADDPVRRGTPSRGRQARGCYVWPLSVAVESCPRCGARCKTIHADGVAILLDEGTLRGRLAKEHACTT